MANERMAQRQGLPIVNAHNLVGAGDRDRLAISAEGDFRNARGGKENAGAGTRRDFPEELRRAFARFDVDRVGDGFAQ
jgi:hypothetical protein